MAATPPSRSDSGPPARRGERTEVVTSTGWRLVGSAADLVSNPTAPVLEPSGREDDILYAAHFVVRPRLGTHAVDALLSALNETLSRVRPDRAPLARQGAVAESAGRFHALVWDTYASGERWTGELIWRHAHPVVAGVACTTHLVVVEQPGHVTLTVRVDAPGGVVAVGGLVGAGQARPAILAEINRRVRLVFDGVAEPRTLGEADIEAFVRDVLLSETRQVPVAILSPTEEGEYAVAPAQLAEELLGVAHLVVLDRHATTFRLTDTLGDRRLSCYFGALRVYMPEFSCADRPDQHPLLVDDRLMDPVVRSGLVGALSRGARRRVSPPARVADLRFADARASRGATVAPSGGTPTGARVPATPGPSGDAGAVSAGAELTAMVSRLVATNAALLDEVTQLRMTTAVRAASASALERRVGSLERLLRDFLARPDAESAALPREDEPLEEPVETASELTLLQVVRQAEVAHADALLILETALASAAESPFEDVGRVAVVLDAMAQLARRRQAGTLGVSLREAFREYGIDYRGGIASSTSKRLRRQYLARLPAGDAVECDEHVVLGTSYDPRHCLRIYFTSLAPAEPRFVIAHAGRHFDVVTTT